MLSSADCSCQSYKTHKNSVAQTECTQGTNILQLHIPGMWGYCNLRSFCAVLTIWSLNHLCPSSIFTSLSCSPRHDKETSFGVHNLVLSISLFCVPWGSSSFSFGSSCFWLVQHFPPLQWLLQQSPFLRQRHFLVEHPVVHLQLML